MIVHKASCAVAILLLGLNGAVSADAVALLDHFEDPANAVNTSLWSAAGASGITVASSVVFLPASGPNSGYLWSNNTFDSTVVGTYEFKYIGSGGSGQRMGLAGNGEGYIMNYGGWRAFTSNSDMGAIFTPVAGDALGLKFTGANWQVYQNGTLVSETNSSSFTGGDAWLYVHGVSGTLELDSISVPSSIPEPSVLALLSTGLIGLLAYIWRKRR